MVTPPAPTNAATGGLRLFAANSVWNTLLTPDAPLDPSSPARAGAFIAEINREIAGGSGPWISETANSTPFYTVGPDQPGVPVSLDTGSWGNTLRSALGGGVPIPANAVPAAGTDHHMTIYQPSTDTLWEFWHASKQANGWHAGWGGAMQHVSSSPGYFSNSAWTGLAPSDGWDWGATASSLPVIAGTIMIDELRSGHIDHALALDIPSACTGFFSWPAQRTDGRLNSADCLPEGAHLRLDPSLDLSKLNLPPITRMLAEAAQRYGMIVRDQTGGSVGFYAQDPTPTGSDPYNGPNGFYQGKRPWNFLPQFPWAHVELLQMKACSSAPCLP